MFPGFPNIMMGSGIARDPYWNDVTLLLDGSGGGGATIPDRSSVNHTVTNVSSGVSNSNTTGPYGTTQDVLEFDGVDDKLTVAGFSDGGRSFGTGDFTIECWVKCSANRSSTGHGGASSFEPFIDNDFNNYGFTDENWFKLEYDFRNSTRLARLSLSNGSGAAAVASYDLGSTSVTDVSQWHHVAAVRSGSTATLYFDGVSSPTSSMSHSVDMVYSHNRTLEIGSQTVIGTARWFSGQLADIRITKGVARYTSNFTPPTESFPTQ